MRHASTQFGLPWTHQQRPPSSSSNSTSAQAPLSPTTLRDEFAAIERHARTLPDDPQREHNAMRYTARALAHVIDKVQDGHDMAQFMERVNSAMLRDCPELLLEITRQFASVTEDDPAHLGRIAARCLDAAIGTDTAKDSQPPSAHVPLIARRAQPARLPPGEEDRSSRRRQKLLRRRLLSRIPARTGEAPPAVRKPAQTRAIASRDAHPRPVNPRGGASGLGEQPHHPFAKPPVRRVRLEAMAPVQ
jgi:hypothetical protein